MAAPRARVRRSPPVGVPRRYGTASKVAIAVSALAAVVWGVKATGVLAAKPLTYQYCGLAAIRDQVTADLDKPVGSRRPLDGALTS